MPYNEAHLALTEHLKILAECTKAQLDELTEFDITLRTAIQTLEARYDANVKASTDTDADYAAEVADARTDSWGNAYEALGANIRKGQQRLAELIESTQKAFQNQIDDLSETRIGNAIEEVSAHERRKAELSQESFIRAENDTSLQGQVEDLSEAVLMQSVMLAEIREMLLELKKEE